MTAWYNLASTGLRGAVVRPSSSIVDDYGNLIEFYMPGQNLWARGWFYYHTSCHSGYGIESIYIV